MGYSSVLECYKNQIGQGNGPGRSNKYTRWFYGDDRFAPWCAIMMCWAFDQVGIYDRLDTLAGKAGCENWRKWAINKGIWGRTPKVNSVVLYDWNASAGDGADHIGIVESITNDGIIAIEGNTSANGSQSNGGYVMRKHRYNSDIMGYIYVDTMGEKPKPSPMIEFDRIYGKNRYETSKNVIKRFCKDFDSVVLVNGNSFADALSGSYFAREKKAPLLLTSNGLLNSTVQFLRGYDIKTVYLIGGTGVLSSQFEQEFKKYNLNVFRMEGKSRYDTNLAVLKACELPNKQVIVVSGKTFPDGLCAGMIDRPVLLVHDRLNQKQLDWLKRKNKFNTFYILGGTGAVSTTVEEQLKAFGEVNRYFGNNRYATSTKIAAKFFPGEKIVVFASGKEFSDGLSACNIGDYPLILVDDSFVIEARKYLTQLVPTKVYVVGGPGAITNDGVNWALTKLEKVNA